MHKINQTRLTMYKEQEPNYLQTVWANYDEEGFFVDITNFYGNHLKLLKGNKVSINKEIWIIKGHLNRYYHD